MNDTTATATPPAGWYPDSAAPGAFRYWAGNHWTNYYTMNPEQPYPYFAPSAPPRRSVVGTTLGVLVTVFFVFPVVAIFGLYLLGALGG